MATEQAQRTVMQHNSPSTAIVRLLQKRGQASIKELELALGVTATAVREQLSHLMAEGVVDAVRVRGDVGRPFYVYHLTDKAQEMFPKAYGTLARLLLEEVLVLHGPDAYTQLLERVGKRLEQDYAGVVVGREMEDKLYGLATLLMGQGFESEVTRTADGFVLHATTCPYFAVVKDHREICDMEQQMMADLLDAEVQLGPCMREGHAACLFQVRPNAARKKPVESEAETPA
jgi:predicted ArsR family transcriptional regulator